MVIAIAYLIIFMSGPSNPLVAIPYKTMEQCQRVAQQIEGDSNVRGHAYCIEGSK